MRDFILLDLTDNVATALKDLPAGYRLKADNGLSVVADVAIPSGHKIALCDIALAGVVIKYGKVIGKTTTSIKAGELVHVHNVTSLRGKSRHE